MLIIRIPGPPVAQGRPRAFQRGGKVRMYDPAKSRAWKALAQVHYQAARKRPAPLFRGPLAVTVQAFFPRPKDWSASSREEGRSTAHKLTRPDCDNIAKAALDAGNGVLWADDAQVAELIVRKWVCYSGQEPFVEVTVRELEA